MQCHVRIKSGSINIILRFDKMRFINQKYNFDNPITLHEFLKK